MSDKLDLTKLEGDDREDQILDGLQKIASFSETQANRAKENVQKITDRVDGFENSVNKVQERFEGKLESVVGIISEKLQRMERRQSATGRLSIIDNTDVILASIDDEDRHVVRMMETTKQESRDRGKFADPVFKAGSALWFRSATRLQLPGAFGQFREIDERKLRRIADAFSSGYAGDQSKNVMVEGTDALGGYSVPTPVEAELLRLIEDNSVMRPLVQKIPMDSKTMQIPKRGSAITAAVIAENSTITDAVPAAPLAALLLTAKKFAGTATVSIEAIQDSVLGLMSYIQTAMAEAIGQLEDKEALEGTSTFIGVAADAGVNEITATGNDGDAVSFAKLVATVFKSRERSGRVGARWFMAPEAMAKVTGLRADAVTGADGAGLPIFQWANVPNGIFPTLLGFPIEVISTIKIDRTKGSGTTLTNVYFGPPNAIIFGDRQGMSWEVSNAPNWGKYLVDMRLTKRTGIGVGVPKSFTRAIDLITA